MKTCKSLAILSVFLVAVTCQADPADDHSTAQSTTESNPVVYLLDVEDIYGSASHIAASVIQGLANRNGPRVFINTGDKHWVARFHDDYTHLEPGTLDRYRGSDDVWVEHYAEKHGFQFQQVNDTDTLAEHVGDAIKGTILYDPHGPGEMIVSWTMAGIHDAVPVTETMLQHCAYLKNLRVIEDLRGRFGTDLAAQQWAFDNLMALCTKEAVFSRAKPSEIDLGVAQKTFFFNLDYMKIIQPDQVRLLDKILATLEPLSPVYGWGTSERSMLNRMAQFGSFLQCSDSPNLSFHRAVEPLRQRFSHPRRLKLEDVTLENKYYVCMVGNEGDTLKQIASLQRGAWLNPERGKIPFNWGMCPWVNDNFPALVEYYYDTMTENDSFCSIVGYAFYGPKYHVELDALCRAEAVSNELFDIYSGSMYSSHACIPATNGIWDALTDKWVVNRGCDGYIFECSQQANLQFSSINQPVIGMDWKFFYWWYRFEEKGQHESLDEMAEYIQQQAYRHEPPFFFPIYGGTPELLCKFAKLLPKDRFKVVLMNEMIAAAKLAGQVHLADDILDLRDKERAKVSLAVRNMGTQEAYDGVITVTAPPGWQVIPSEWDYMPIPVNGKQETTFTVAANRNAKPGLYKIAFNDSRTGLNDVLRVNIQDEKKPSVRQSQATTKLAKKATIQVDGDIEDWAHLGSDAIVLDMADSTDSMETNLKVQSRFAWDDDHLYLLVEELPGDDRAYESVMGQEFESSEFLIADAVVFWFDFDGDGTSENGDFTLYLGLSSEGRADLYCCTLNDQVLVSTYPNVSIITSGKLGARVIEAAIKWSELEYILKDEFVPPMGLRDAVQSGFSFGCEPYATDGEINISKVTSHGMYINGSMKEKPSGFDPHSIDVLLAD